MSELLDKRHNVSVLMYHIVCPVKYRRAVFTPEVEQVLKDICLAIEQRYEIRFLEIGTDPDHVHFLVEGWINESRLRDDYGKSVIDKSLITPEGSDRVG